MAIDWGSVANVAIDAIQGQVPGGGAQQYFPSGGMPSGAPAAPIPAKVTVDTRTGKVTPCRRRRRRKLLTDQDFACLMQISSLPNKENVRIALAKAIR
jgi:hypothetical protein